MSKSNDVIYDPEPRWPAFVAVIAVAGLYAALPHALIIGPRWMFPSVLIVLLIPTLISHWKDYRELNRVLGFAVSIAVTIGLVGSVIFLVRGLPAHAETPAELLTSAASLWVTNILVFTLWYWRLDAGGPHSRDRRAVHTDGAFLFPQMTMSPEQKRAAGETNWSPNFFDYLFLSFNTSTAFSPTDVPVLARWAKILMMLQSMISLTVLALLAARAVNIL
ncbi:MAG TPA: hypothetical protein VGQ55_11390 [Pyrinomonadaceae bacterium]|jgi:uncharacterized membrane protein|nr:hypothetical protein [Pyrinomonadaceae bacterium]